MDKRTFDKKVSELAAKLQSSGASINDAMARSMAEDIIRTEMSKSMPTQTYVAKPGHEKVVTDALARAETMQQYSVDDSSVSVADASVSQPKITLDTPVVVGSTAREEIRSEPEVFVPPRHVEPSFESTSPKKQEDEPVEQSKPSAEPNQTTESSDKDLKPGEVDLHSMFKS